MTRSTVLTPVGLAPPASSKGRSLTLVVLAALAVPVPAGAGCEWIDKTATMATLLFDGITVGGAILVLAGLSRLVTRLWLRALVTAAGVLVFEMFTAPMWVNQKLGRFAYVYVDVSWVLTVGWTALILGVVLLVDHLRPAWGEARRFVASLLVLLPLVVVAESVVLALGIRDYAPEVRQALSGHRLLNVPVEILYYVPVFTGLIVAFYKYWAFVIDRAALVPVARRKWLRATGIAFVGVFLFEVMVEPLVDNRAFPAWSYVFRDISILQTLMWVVIIAVVAVFVERLFIHWPIPGRFGASLLGIGAIALPIESWLIHHGYRVYGESSSRNFTGFRTPITDVPVEVAFAIPIYLALVVAFIRYWEVVLDNEL